MEQKFSTLDRRFAPAPAEGGGLETHGGSTWVAGPSVIDLEAQDLSGGQVKAIHGQIKRDCSLLRNRVRMLQNEMAKANKKIEETKKKTYDIKMIRLENDQKYMVKLEKHRD